MKHNQKRKPPSQKKNGGRKMLILRVKIGNLLNIAGLNPGLSLLLNLRFSSDLYRFNFLAKRKNNKIIIIKYIRLQIPTLKVKSRQSADRWKILERNLYLGSGPDILLNFWFHLCFAFVYLVIAFVFILFIEHLFYFFT